MVQSILRVVEWVCNKRIVDQGKYFLSILSTMNRVIFNISPYLFFPKKTFRKLKLIGLIC